MILCLTCKEEKPESEFYKQKIKKGENVRIYYQPHCKECRGIGRSYNKGKLKKTTIHESNLSEVQSERVKNDIRSWINEVIRRDFYVNEIDFFRIAHYHIIVFGWYNNIEKTAIGEVVSNWKDLHKWYLEDGELKISKCLECSDIVNVVDMKFSNKCSKCTSSMNKIYRERAKIKK
jgi:hypothetical protein